jgi:hypothetical protein
MVAFGFKNPKGSGSINPWGLFGYFTVVWFQKTRLGLVVITRKGMVTYVLDSFEFLHVCLNLIVFGGLDTLTLWFFQICWDLQVLSGLVCLHSGYLLLERVGTWILPFWRLIHSPFLNSNCFRRGSLIFSFIL